MRCFIVSLLLLFCIGCSSNSGALFIKKTSDHTGIGFINKLTYTEEFNPYTYRNFYNGAGVAVGDINNDGLLDLFFTGNIVGNKLYLNQGNFKFKDITVSAGVGCEELLKDFKSPDDINHVMHVTLKFNALRQSQKVIDQGLAEEDLVHSLVGNDFVAPLQEKPLRRK